MRRKAAAAAYDAAALLKTLQKQTVESREKVQLYSRCMGHVLRLLRLFLQSQVRQMLEAEAIASDVEDEDDAACDDETVDRWLATDLSTRLPQAVTKNLLSALASFMSSSTYTLSVLFWVTSRNGPFVFFTKKLSRLGRNVFLSCTLLWMDYATC